MDDLIDVCVKHMANEEHSEEEIRLYLQGTLPKLDYWKKYKELAGDGAFEEFKKFLIAEINELCFEGNINFYGKSGFAFASEFGLRYHGLPEVADASFFLCKELIPGYLSGITGEYGPPEVYLFPEEEAEEFDKKFPYKEKQKLPGQLF